MLSWYNRKYIYIYIYITGDLYRSGTSLTSALNNFVTNTSLTSTLSSYVTNTSLTSSLSNYASLNNPIFGGSNLYFLTTSNGGWNISYSSSSFGISLNNVIQALSINNTGLITITTRYIRI